MSGVGESSKPSRAIVAQILLVEDDADHAEVMADALHKPGHICTIVSDVAGAMDELRGGTFDVVVTDLRMPNSGGVSGLDGQVVASDGGNAGLIVLQAARALQSQAETIMVTAHGDVPTARSAFKEGAFDFIEKPLDLEVFRSVVNRAAETVLLRHEGDSIGEGLSELVQHDGFEGIIAASEPMRRIFTTIKTVAPSKLPVLVTGESGTGKELIAQAVHTNSDRSGKRFATFNAAGQAESLLEDQLFGHVKGAFTGADKDRMGRFELADEGTLFLDEIANITPQQQARLLRVLEAGEVERVGASKSRKIDVRILSATNADLPAMIAEGEFREDLLFRLNTVEIRLPPLRERAEDIPLLAAFFLEKAVRRYRKLVEGFDDSALRLLRAHPWPGNVRELDHVVQRAVLMAGGATITAADMGLAARADSAPRLEDMSLDEVERRLIKMTLERCNGSVNEAAEQLGLSRSAMYRRLQKHGL